MDTRRDVATSTTWTGWIGFAAVMLILIGSITFFAAFGLAAKAGWARWFTIIAVGLNLLAQLGFLGNTQYPLWSLVIIALDIVVLYALTARWGEVETI